MFIQELLFKIDGYKSIQNKKKCAAIPLFCLSKFGIIRRHWIEEIIYVLLSLLEKSSAPHNACNLLVSGRNMPGTLYTLSPNMTWSSAYPAKHSELSHTCICLPIVRNISSKSAVHKQEVWGHVHQKAHCKKKRGCYLFQKVF